MLLDGRFYVLNYTKKNVNIITLCITIFVCIILFIMLDMCFLKATEAKVYSNYQKYSSLKSEHRSKNAMDLKDTYLGLMQIADIYDENTKIEEVENVNTNEGDGENSENSGEDMVKATKINLKAKWRIEIPKINVIAPIKSGTTQDVLAAAVGHFEQTDKWNGNVALAGHNRGYNCNFFQNIKKLEIGDKIIYHTEKGERKYKVVMNKIIKQTDWRYIQETEDNRITLITCVENQRNLRLCVLGVEKGE